MIRRKVNILRKFRIFPGGGRCQPVPLAAKRKRPVALPRCRAFPLVRILANISETGTQVTESGEGVQIRSYPRNLIRLLELSGGLVT